MKFKTGDKVKVVSLNNSFSHIARKNVYDCLYKTFTVRDTEIINDSQHDIRNIYVTVKENRYYWNIKDLILSNNNLDIE